MRIREDKALELTLGLVPGATGLSMVACLLVGVRGEQKALKLQWRSDLGEKQREPPLLGRHALPSAGCSPRFSGLDSSWPLSRTGGQCLLIEIPQTGPGPSLAEVKDGPPPPEAGPVWGSLHHRSPHPDFFAPERCLLCSQKKAVKLFSSG